MLTDVSALPPQLTSLSLENNRLTSPLSFPRLSKLAYLSLKANNIRMLAGARFSSFYISFLLMIVAASSFQGLQILGRLNLDNNNFEDLSALQHLTSLEALSVRSNRLTHLDFCRHLCVGLFAAMRGLTFFCSVKLRSLDASFNMLVNVGNLGELIPMIVELKLGTTFGKYDWPANVCALQMTMTSST